LNPELNAKPASGSDPMHAELLDSSRLPDGT
jgi:hypothetical protein